MRQLYGGTLIHRCRDEHGVIEIVEDAFHRALHFGTPPRQSAMRLDDPASLVLGYSRAMMCALLFTAAPRSALLIGLGGGSLVKYLLHHFPDCRITAVELREQVARLAHDYFALPEDKPNLNVLIADGGDFVGSAAMNETYDLILIDAFHEAGMSDVVSDDFFYNACRSRLSNHGVLAANLWQENTAALRHTLDALSVCFDGQSLRLPVPGKGNLVALAFNAPFPPSSLRRVRPRLPQLQERYDIEFSVFLREMRRANRFPIFRTGGIRGR